MLYLWLGDTINGCGIMTGTRHVKFTNLLTHQYTQSCGMQCSMLELLVDGYSHILGRCSVAAQQLFHWCVGVVVW